MWAIPGLLKRAQVCQDALHLRSTECLPNHHCTSARTASQELPDLCRSRQRARTPDASVSSKVQKFASTRRSLRTRVALFCFCLLQRVEEVVNVPFPKDQTMTHGQRGHTEPSTRWSGFIARHFEAILSEDLKVRFGQLLLRRGELQVVRRDQRLAIDARFPIKVLKTELLVRRMLVNNEDLEHVSVRPAVSVGPAVSVCGTQQALVPSGSV
mmetsp:Transcript_36000/g.83760  ORF Transcript_36000/g.83760 Transcript_36000/m.83760 type:complete len:212 (+) Transcript_36000:226-861(+)